MKNLYISDFEFLPIVFPDYRLVRECEYVKKGWIYIGRDSVPGDLEAICVVPFLNRTVDVSLPDNLAITKFAYSRKGKDKIPSQVEKRVMAIREKYIFVDELKRFMAVGKWVSLTDVDVKVYRMFRSFLETRRDFLYQYFSLREVYSFEYVSDCILTFFRRVVDVKTDLQDFSRYYRKIIDGFRHYREQILASLFFLSRNHFDETVFLAYLLELKIH